MNVHADPDSTALLDFGPYSGRDVASVAVADPGYLLDLVREGIGSDSLRAEAARALALRARLVPPGEPWPAGSGWSAALPGAASALPAAYAAPAEPAFAGRTLAGGAVQGAAATPARMLATARPWQLTLVVAAAIGAAMVFDGRVVPESGGDVPFSTRPTAVAAAVATAVPVGAPRLGRSPSVSELPPASPPEAGAGSPPPCGARVPGAIPAESATDYLDTYQAVEFEVVQAKDTGRVTFLNSRIPYAGAFYVAIFPDDYAAFPEPPATYLAGRCIVVQGTIEIYRGAPQIVLRHPDDLRLVEAPSPGSSSVSDAEPAERARPVVAQPTPPRAGPATPRAAR